MEQTAKQVKDAIKQLPIQQRAVAIALKNIFDQVKKVTRQQQQAIDQNHLEFIKKFKVLEQKASDIIQGKKVLTEQDLDKSADFFNPEQLSLKQQALSEGKGIKEFWFSAIQNSEYGPDLTKQQQAILKAVSDLQTNITTNEIELVLTIQKNDYVSEGVFHRRLVLDNGMPKSFEGDEAKWISSEQRQDGILVSYILSNTKVEDQLSTIFSIVGNIVNQIVPYSLEYFLGAVDQEEQGDDEDEDEEERDEADDQ